MVLPKKTKKINSFIYSIIGAVFFCALFAYGFFLFPECAAASGESWLTGYTYRKQVTITGSTDGSLTDYQIKLTLIKSTGTDSGGTIYLGENVLDSFNDIRLTDSDGETLLNYWLESVSGSTATVWTKVGSIPASPNTAVIYLYYDKTGDTSASSGSNTFAFFDDFNDNSIDTNKWTVSTNNASYAAYAESGGYARLNGYASGVWNLASWKATSTFGPGHAIRTSQYYSGYAYPQNIHSQTGFASDDWNDHIAINIQAINWVPPYTFYLLDSAKSGTGTTTNINNPQNAWKTFDIIWTSSANKVIGNGSLEATVSDSSYISTNSALYPKIILQPGAGTAYVYTDWFAVRKITASEPTLSSGVGATQTYTLTYTAGANGSITGSSPQSVNPSEDGSAVTAVPATGYHFVNWSDASTSNPRTDTNVTDDITVTANFAINTYTLTYSAGANGTLTGTASQTVNYGSDGSAVTAVPATGYHFVDWSDASTENPRTDTSVTDDVTVTANFAINTYTLTYSAGANGTLTGTASQTVNYGSDGSAVTAVPNDGYDFSSWSDNSTDNPRTDINVAGDITVTANFIVEEVESLADDDVEDLTVDNIVYSSTINSITIEWETNIKADSKVKYGKEKNDLNKENSNNEREKEHKVILKKLDNDTIYYFKIYSEDENGNEDKSRIHSIRTKAVNVLQNINLSSSGNNEMPSESSEQGRETVIFPEREYLPLDEVQENLENMGSAQESEKIDNTLEKNGDKNEKIFSAKVDMKDGKKILSEMRIRIIGANGRPIPNLPVTLFSDPKRAITDEDGVAVFNEVPVEKHTLVLNYQNREFKKEIAVSEPRAESGEVQVELVTIKVGSEQSMLIWGWALLALFGGYAIYLQIRFRRSPKAVEKK